MLILTLFCVCSKLENLPICITIKNLSQPDTVLQIITLTWSDGRRIENLRFWKTNEVLVWSQLYLPLVFTLNCWSPEACSSPLSQILRYIAPLSPHFVMNCWRLGAFPFERYAQIHKNRGFWFAAAIKEHLPRRLPETRSKWFFYPGNAQTRPAQEAGKNGGRKNTKVIRRDILTTRAA